MDKKSRALPLFLWCTVAILVLYTRFFSISWGLPYPFHPDERNMADAVMQLRCVAWDTNCFNPHFFAYGQFPLYLAYILLTIYRSFLGNPISLSSPLSFIEATLSLRFIAACVSCLTSWVLVKTLGLFIKERSCLLISTVAIIFSPVLIQFAHFGTTESLLIFFYSLLIYLSLLVVQKKMSLDRYLLGTAVICGLSLATKISAFSFVLLPLFLIIYSIKKHQSHSRLVSLFTICKFSIGVMLVMVIFSPYNFIAFQDFLSSMMYESGVGTGKFEVFYTRQFTMMPPVLFQLLSVFPYALGRPVFLGSILALFFLPYKKEFLFLRLAFFIPFIFNAFLFTKWTRFMAADYPVMLIMALLFCYYAYEKIKLVVPVDTIWKLWNLRLLYGVLLIVLAIPGLGFMRVYAAKDIRFTASEWIYAHIPNESTILSESGNVVDLPITSSEDINQWSPPQKMYQVIPFNFYDLDQNPQLQQDLSRYLNSAQYILVPSRRVFANVTCTQDTFINHLFRNSRCTYLEKKYPVTNSYYNSLFSGKLGFELVKEWKVLDDEEAEETWSVFDHPVIRLYKRSSP